MTHDAREVLVGVLAILGGCGGLCSREHFLRIQKPKIS